MQQFYTYSIQLSYTYIINITLGRKWYLMIKQKCCIDYTNTLGCNHNLSNSYMAMYKGFGN